MDVLNVDVGVQEADYIDEVANAQNSGRDFKTVATEVLRTDDTDTLVLHGGSSEITDIDVNKAVMDTKKNFEEHKKEWFEKVEEDSNKLFDIAVVAAKSLNKVVIVKRHPRYDRRKDDFLGIKSQLSKYANACLDQLWVKRCSPDTIRIVEIAGIESDGFPHLHDILYGKRRSQH